MIQTRARKKLKRSQVETTEEGVFVKIAFYPGPGQFLGVRELGEEYELIVYEKKEGRA